MGFRGVTFLFAQCFMLFGCASKSAKQQVRGVKPAPPHWPPTYIHGLDPKTLEDCPWQSRTYDPAWVSSRAKELLLRPVDYLHKVNTGEIKP